MVAGSFAPGVCDCCTHALRLGAEWTALGTACAPWGSGPASALPNNTSLPWLSHTGAVLFPNVGNSPLQDINHGDLLEIQAQRTFNQENTFTNDKKQTSNLSHVFSITKYLLNSYHGPGTEWALEVNKEQIHQVPASSMHTCLHRYRQRKRPS